MHSSGIVIPGWHQVTIHHNGDWSGSVQVCAWFKDGPPETEPDLEVELTEGFVAKYVRAPKLTTKDGALSPQGRKVSGLLFAVGVEVGRAMAVDKLTTFIEQKL